MFRLVRCALIFSFFVLAGWQLSARGAEEQPPPPDQSAKPAEGTEAAPQPAEEQDNEAATPAAPATPAKPAVTRLPEIVVTASRLPTPIDETGVSMTVVNGKENSDVFQRIQFCEALRDVPGVTVQQSGAPGDFTTLTTRGGNSNQTLFLYDGWKVNRQGGYFDLGHVSPVQIDRIEVARGPSSSLFGTDAMTGTVNLLTAKGAGEPEVTSSAAGGTYGTDRETISVQGQEKQFSYNVSTAHLHRSQFMVNNSELETYDYAARFDYQINAEHSIKAVIRGYDYGKGYYENSATGYGIGVELPDPNDQVNSLDLLTGLEYKGHLLPIWDTTLRLGYYLFEEHVTSEPPNPVSTVAGFAASTGYTTNHERRPSLDWQNDITAFASEDEMVRNIVTAGISAEQERYNQDDSIYFSNVNSARTNWSVFMQNRLELFKRAYITGGVRREQNGQFGEFTTGRADVSLPIPESGSRIHGAVGNAFRAPSFYEFFSAFGNPNLKPEKNFAYDVGLEQCFWKKRVTLDATWFNNDFKDLVTFGFNTNRMENLNRAHSRGLELAGEIRPVKQFTFRATGTFLHTDDDNGHHLLRRPGSTYTAQAIVRPIKGLDLSLDLLRMGGRADLGPEGNNPFATVRNEGYTRLDAAASYSFQKHWRVFGRLQNLLNEHYQDVKTFPSPGSNALAGVEFTWRF